MSIAELLTVAAFAALAWLWLDSLKAREIAVRAARDACAADGLLFLDETVAIVSIRPTRDAHGRVVLARRYEFEYSDTGDNRRKGGVALEGHRVVLLNVGAREGGGNVYTLH